MKFLSILLVVVLMFGMVGCSNQQEDSSGSTPSENTPVSSTPSGTEDNSQTSKPDDDVSYDNWAKVGGKSIYVNYRDGRRKDEHSMSVVFHSNHTDMVALTYNKVDQFTGDLGSVFDFLNTGAVFSDVASYAEANFFDTSKSYKIEKASEKNVKIGDLDTVEIKGSVVDANGRTCFVYGYTFVIENVPCFLVGFVFTEAQDQGMIDAITAEVGEMVKTVRTER